MKSTVVPSITVSIAVVAAYHLGRTSGVGTGHNAGLFGTAVATMGMLSSACYVLSMNNYGPIADNAGMYGLTRGHEPHPPWRMELTPRLLMSLAWLLAVRRHCGDEPAARVRARLHRQARRRRQRDQGHHQG